MSLPLKQTGSAEFEQSEWLQFEIPGLEDYDFDTFELPRLSPVNSTSTTLIQTAAQAPKTNSPAPTSPSARPRGPSVVTLRRRSSAKSNEAMVSVTLEGPNGRRRSWDITIDSAHEAWLNMVSTAEQVSASMQPQVATNDVQSSLLADQQPNQQDFSFPQSPLLMPNPVHAPSQGSYLSSYIQAAEPSYQIMTPHLPMGQQFFAPAPAPQMVPMISSPPMDGARRRPVRVPAPAQGQRQTQQHPTDMMTSRQPARSHLPSSRQVGPGSRPPLPDDITLYVNPHHLPHNHGRVPDKRGTKDTTVANDYYYSISKLDSLTLPTSGLTVSYSGIEFDAGLHFTGDEFLEYLDRAAQRPTRQPILRIQMQPAQYNHRYMRAGQSFKCRFAHCPDKRGTILKGQARVCISEFDDPHGDWLNPFHNAGYVHLFCLEQQLNFIALCRGDSTPGIIVVPETRSLAHEPPATGNMRLNNPMILNDVERTVVAEWMAEIGGRWDAFKALHRDPTLRPAFELAQEDTLTYRLTKTHIASSAPLRRAQMKRKLDAGGRLTAHLDEFVGDVGKQVAMQTRAKRQPRPSSTDDTGKNAREHTVPSPGDERACKRRRALSPR